ncbi:MAG: polysaccharide deacetylase family protein [Candidatus Marinimicrobia bacterium]|nr:polysaccharide deacetylase family protein [Candidatus Neomarinimicrobiota bacterium]
MDHLQEQLDPVNGNGHDDMANTALGLTDTGRDNVDDSRNIKILLYHRIVEDKKLLKTDTANLCTHVDQFRYHLEILEMFGYTPITLHDYQLYLQGEVHLPRKPIIITFDDGYLDTFNLAYPALHERGMTAVFFVLGDRTLEWNEWDADISIEPAPLMDDDLIRELHQQGFEIGSHTLSHPDLTRVPEWEAWREIGQSKSNLTELLGEPIHSFSYPYSSVDDKIRSFARTIGYSFACSVYTGPPEFGKEPHEIRRIEIHNDISLFGFMTRLLLPVEQVYWSWWKMMSTIDSERFSGTAMEHDGGGVQNGGTGT